MTQIHEDGVRIELLKRGTMKQQGLRKILLAMVLVLSLDVSAIADDYDETYTPETIVPDETAEIPPAEEAEQVEPAPMPAPTDPYEYEAE